jgi:glyoxylase-like metal-dependent hydrolase (beta-lactamase superfamily II)
MTGQELAGTCSLRIKLLAKLIRQRTWVVTGRERHVGHAREENLTYPHRALRTPDFLYIRNFHPERWPMGNPRDITEYLRSVSQDALENETYAAFPGYGREPDEGLARRPSQRCAMEEVLRLRLRQTSRPRNSTISAKTQTK